MKQTAPVTACLLSLLVLWNAPQPAAQQPADAGPQGRGGNAPAAGRGGGGGPAKADNLPANFFAAKRYATMPTQRQTWVDVPSGTATIRTLIAYPPGEDRAGVVILMSHEPGLDDWMRAAADQVAHDGFIAIAPDLLTGRGPRGGNTDAFPFPDEAIRARAAVTAADALRIYQAARDYGLKLPRANGKSASVGFSGSGTDSWRFAASVPSLNAAVVFYGAAPGDDVLARITAPVLGLYGELDTVVGPPTVQGTAGTMKRLGKQFEFQIYPHAANLFLIYQDMAQNGAAANEAWPRAMAFLKQHLQ